MVQHYSKSKPMQEHIIETPRGQNIGQNIINYLQSKQLYGNVNILTIDTQRNVRQRVNTTVVAVKAKS